MKTTFPMILCLLIALESSAQIYQFRGPERDGKFPEENLMKTWPEEGPELLLEFEGIGEGYSSVISNGKLIYASGKLDSMDYLSCIDFEGNRLWQVPYGKAWELSFPYTRGTPTLEDDRIYIISGMGELACLDALSGEIHWKVNVDEQFQADWHRWGVAEAPLIVGELVISSPASSLATFVAFDKTSGEVVWKSPGTDGQRSYVSPILHEFHGITCMLGASASELYLVDPQNGDLLSSYTYFDPDLWKWQPRGIIWANSPVVKENRIFVAIGYDYPAKMLQVTDDLKSMEEVYTDTLMDNHHHGMIEVDGKLYGSNWINNNSGNWVCLDWETGALMYDERWNSKGQLVYADGMFYAYIEKTGHMGLVQADPSGFKVVSSFQVVKGKGPHWSHPYIHDGKLFLRHGDVLMVYSIKDQD